MAVSPFNFDAAIIHKDAKESQLDTKFATCKHVPILKTFVRSNVLLTTKFRMTELSSIGRHITTMLNLVLSPAGNDFPHELSPKGKM